MKKMTCFLIFIILNISNILCQNSKNCWIRYKEDTFLVFDFPDTIFKYKMIDFNGARFAFAWDATERHKLASIVVMYDNNVRNPSNPKYFDDSLKLHNGMTALIDTFTYCSPLPNFATVNIKKDSTEIDIRLETDINEDLLRYLDLFKKIISTG